MLPTVGIFKKTVWIYLAVFIFDIILRVATFGFWLFNYQDFPQLPLFTKGIKFPEIQVLILLMELTVVIGTFLVKRNYHYFQLLKYLCIIFGTITLILSMFYSHNVAGSSGIFIFFALYLHQTARENRLLI